MVDIGKNRKIILDLIFFLTFVLVVFLVASSKLNFLIDFVRSSGILGEAVYVGYAILSTVISPLNALIFFPVVLKAYGFWTSVLLSFFGFGIGGILNFYIAKHRGRETIQKLVGPEILKEIDMFTKVTGWKTLLVIRLLGSNLYDYISYAMGLTTISWRTYLVVTLPTLFVWQIIVFYVMDRAILVKGFYGLGMISTFLLVSFLSGYIVWRRYTNK